VIIQIQVKVPIAAGFGTSAAGTLASCLAFSNAADLSMTFNELGRVTHVAEVLNGTGLGTASALLCGGFVLVREPGAPGVGLIDRLRFPLNHCIVCAYLGPIQTREALANSADHTRFGAAGHVAFEAISKNPTVPVFLAESRKFGKQTGFETPRVTRLISTMMSAGAVGAAQNMIGEAVHAVVENSKKEKVLRVVREAFPFAKVFASPVDNQGVRLQSEK
jgi:pantoate kinase